MQAAKKTELEQKRLNLKNQLNAVERLLTNAFIDENKPLFEKKYNDTYWTYTNSYGCIGKRWIVYVHAKKVDSVWDCGSNGINSHIICDTFQLTSDNNLLIDFNSKEYHSQLKKKITKKEFTNAVSKMLNKAKEAVK